jgi:hypothetical protein
VSAAYVNGEGPVQPIANAIGNVSPQAVTVTFSSASVLVFHRDHRMYSGRRPRLCQSGKDGLARLLADGSGDAVTTRLGEISTPLRAAPRAALPN